MTTIYGKITTGPPLPMHSVLRSWVPPKLRDYGDLYAVYEDRQIVGITDEYGTAHWARDGDLKAVTDLLLDADGNWKG